VKRDRVEEVAREAYKSARLSSLGIEIGVAVGFGLFVGYQADAYFQSSPVGILLGMLVGMIAAARSVRKTLKLYEAAEARAVSKTTDDITTPQN
jgi:F0F1-type ATP synthase assembly protein I